MIMRQVVIQVNTQVSQRVDFECGYVTTLADSPHLMFNAHRYVLEVTVESNPDNMVEFDTLQRIMKLFVPNNRFIYDETSKDLSIDRIVQAMKFSGVLTQGFSFYLCAETLVAYFAEKIQNHFDTNGFHVKVLSAKLRETPSSVATWTSQ